MKGFLLSILILTAFLMMSSLTEAQPSGPPPPPADCDITYDTKTSEIVLIFVNSGKSNLSFSFYRQGQSYNSPPDFAFELAPGSSKILQDTNIFGSYILAVSGPEVGLTIQEEIRPGAIINCRDH